MLKLTPFYFFLLSSCVTDAVIKNTTPKKPRAKQKNISLKTQQVLKQANITPCPDDRKGGGLIIRGGKRKFKFKEDTSGRVRNHVDGMLGIHYGDRVWAGRTVPCFIPPNQGTKELFIMDKTKSNSFLAFYRDPYGASSCDATSPPNCSYQAVFFNKFGDIEWDLNLNSFLSRRDYLEIQDIRYDKGVLYFNEACQSYAKDSNYKCSKLVALNPKSKKVLWKTKYLTSNNRFLILDKYIVSAYGFTAEKDYIFLVEKKSGKILQKLFIPRAASSIEIHSKNRKEIFLTAGAYFIGLSFANGAKHPSMRKIKRP